jgi:inositol-hexakisphosphate kinase
MGPIADAKGLIQHDYRFPLSPPPSAHSSPRAGPLGDGSAIKQPVYRRSTSHSVHWSTTTDGDPLANPTSEQHGPSPRKRPGTSHSSRSLTMPSSSRDPASERGFTLDPPKAENSSSLSRRSSSSTLSSASSRNQPHPNPTSSTTAGIGRKVAASLQLFKESAPRSPSEEKISGFPKADKLLGKRRPSSSHKNENVSEAKYEFVKRTDWPDPETAALRRERSSTALERIRTRESISSHSVKDQESSRARGYTRDSAMHDLSEWRKGVSKQETLRGRRRERASEASVFDFDLGAPRAEPSVSIPSPYIRPRSRGYAPSPSPSLSPTRRVLPRALYNIASDFSSPSARNGHKVDKQRSPRSVSSSLRSRSPTTIHASTYTSESLSLPSSMLYDDVRSYSPWSTDDESAWETTSVTTDASTTTGTSEHPSPSRGVAFTSSYPAAASDEKFERSAHDDLEGGESPPASDTWTERHLDMTFGASDESLPHIPLRPFRNQVGGHSAIYKFTKRAVCKVWLAMSCRVVFLMTLYSP